MALVAFTVDTERDLSWPIPGNALEATTFNQQKPSFDATEKGLQDLLEVLEKLRIKATFFFEAQTAFVLQKKIDLKKLFKNHEIGFHGFNHEDFAGIKTGVKVPLEERKKIFAEGIKALEKVFGRRPTGFRAPYLGTDEALMQLASKNFSYDSSLYGLQVFQEKGFWRIPVSEGNDAEGKKIQGFLWPLMEGDRKVEDYLLLVREAVEKKANPIVIATHSWHTRFTRKNGRLGERQARDKKALVERVLSEIQETEGIEFCTLEEFLKKQNEK